MLYVTLQAEVNPRRLSHELEAIGIQQWIYIGEDSTWRVRAEASMPKNISRISIADCLHETSWELRQPHIDWIGELSQLNDSLEWWASELAAKNPYYNLFIRICLLGVARQLIAAGFKRSTLIVCSSQALYREVMRFAMGCGTPTRRLLSASIFPGLSGVSRVGSRYLKGAYRRMPLLADRILARLPLGQLSERIQRSLDCRPSYRRQVLADMGVKSKGEFSGDDAILLFTWVDGRNFGADGTYRDPHLGQLAELLRERGFRVAYVPRVLFTIAYDEAVNALLKTDERFFFPECYMEDSEWQTCLKRARQFAPVIPEDSSIGDVPVYRLAQEQVDEHRYALAGSLSYETLIANMVSRGVQPRQIIHPCEGHSWEQALAYAVRRYSPDTSVVGYDAGVFSPLVLSMYPAQDEYGLRPLPERIVTHGPLHSEALLAGGARQENIKSGCGLRHSYLWKENTSPMDVYVVDHERPIRVLVAPGIGLGDAVESGAKAARAFGGDSRYEVVIKCHPLTGADLVVRHLGELAQQENVCFVDKPMGELLPSARLLLYTFTSVCFEALQHDVLPIFVRSESFLNLDKLEIAPDVRWVATTPADLRRVAEQISHMSVDEHRAWQSKAYDVVRAALTPITSDCVDAFLV